MLLVLLALPGSQGDWSLQKVLIVQAPLWRTFSCPVQVSPRLLLQNLRRISFSGGNFGGGHAVLTGGGGKDFLVGGLGADVMDGGAGIDSFHGSQGRDVMTGGTPADLFTFAFRASPA